MAARELRSKSGGGERLKRKICADEVAGEDVDVILELLEEATPATPKPARRARVLRAVSVSRSRICAADGQILSEQHLNALETQELRFANKSAGEKQHFFVHYKDALEEPSWEEAVDVGQPLISQFDHLLHIFPLAQPRELQDAELSLLKSTTIQSLCASFNRLLAVSLSAQKLDRKVSCELVLLDSSVFLALFGQTAAFQGETATSLLAHGTTSRNVTFAEMDAVLGPVCTTWFKRTNQMGTSTRVNREKPLRLTLSHMRSTEEDHSDCPRCLYPIHEPVMDRPKFHDPKPTYLFTAWKIRLTARLIKGV
eukprot:m.239463 g.239463  ORF g.239463 m.239463 type:complete len:311 (+) comp22585_c0_seq1:90-1022(+)